MKLRPKQKSLHTLSYVLWNLYRGILIVVLTITVNAFAWGQEHEKKEIDPIFKGSRFIHGQSANLAHQGELFLLIQHRFGDISGGMYDFFGLDYASMRLGFEYGITDNLNIGIGRSTMLKTYNGMVKYRFARQTETFPLTIAATAESSLPSLRDYFPDPYNSLSDKLSAGLMLHLASTVGKFGFQLTPGFLRTGYLLNEAGNFSLFTTDIGASVKVSKKVSVNLEYMHHFNQDLISKKPLSLGLDLDTGGHLFQIMVSNTQAMFTQGLYTNSFGDWSKGKVYFGFNLIREFDLIYRDY